MIIAFTGAGISKESGIDTFQDRPRIREKLTREYATRHPEKYVKVMEEFVSNVSGKKPNDAHLALAEYNIPVITMNVDSLHELAGTKEIIKLHGRLPNKEELSTCNRLYNAPVLYGDPAPEYAKAYDFIYGLRSGDILLVIGASEYTRISSDLRKLAKLYGAKVLEIQNNASIEVRQFLENNKDKIEDVEEYKRRIKQLMEE